MQLTEERKEELKEAWMQYLQNNGMTIKDIRSGISDVKEKTGFSGFVSFLILFTKEVVRNNGVTVNTELDRELEEDKRQARPLREVDL